MSNKPKSGIYVIRCNATRCAYIAISMNVSSRLSQFRHRLRQHKAENKHLLDDYIACSETFEYVTATLCEPNRLNDQLAIVLSNYCKDGWTIYNPVNTASTPEPSVNHMEDIGITEDDIPMIKKLLKIVHNGKISREQILNGLDQF